MKSAVFICFFLSIFILISSLARLTLRVRPGEKSQGRYRNFIADLISRSGLDDRISTKNFILVQGALSLFIFYIFLYISGFDRSVIANVLLLSFILGSLIPVLFALHLARNRKDRIMNDIPYFSDLLTLSCEAGLDVFASMTGILKYFEGSPLKDILTSILKDVKMGKSRALALKKAYKDSDVWDLKAILITIIQSEILGASIGQALRNHSSQMRTDRLNKAEAGAQKAPLKLMIPLLFLIFPVTFIVLLAPLIIRFLNGDFF